MKLFSQRKGLKKTRTTFQVDSIDVELRNRLWNVLKVSYWDNVAGRYRDSLRDYNILFNRMWHNFFKARLDNMPYYAADILGVLDKYFFGCEWYEVYDFLEFIVNNYPDEIVNQGFMKACNAVLEEEMAAYRFVGGQVTPITSETEISEIDEALKTPLKTVNIHLGNALGLLSDRKSPDYRNSIKESISAVEAICRLIAKDQNATLGQALKKIEDKVGLHGALKNAFSNLYGYTSSAGGIRHALLDEKPSLSFEDAKFMLVSCSAFINYLVSKAEKAQLKL